MAQVKPALKIELNPLEPIPEICAVIASIMPYHPEREVEILQGVQKAIDDRINQLSLKEVDLGGTKPLRKPSRI